MGGRLYFAGEATSSEAPSTAHGALESGRRAAGQVIDAAEEGEHIVIIGSGFAGLGCARALVDEDYEVTVLEGRDRIGVLKAATIDFEPALPAAKQGAIKALGAGLLDKLWLEFPKPFWDKEVDVIEWYDPKNPNLWSWWVNGYKAFGKPVLLGLNGGDQAHRLARATDDEVVGSAMRALQNMHS